MRRIARGLSIEYATSRMAVRIAQHPDDRLWQQLQACRSVAALLDVLRPSPAGRYVAAIAATDGLPGIELAFRQQLRLRIDEAAYWVPDAWQPAVAFTRWLVDLPALAHLAATPELPAWIVNDPELTRYSQTALRERHTALVTGPLGAFARADGSARLSQHPAQSALHPLLAAWQREWIKLWPRQSVDDREAFGTLLRRVARHQLRFGGIAVADADLARSDLRARAKALLRHAVARPAAVFAGLTVLALDLERLRALFVDRAAFGGSPS